MFIAHHVLPNFQYSLTKHNIITLLMFKILGAGRVQADKFPKWCRTYTLCFEEHECLWSSCLHISRVLYTAKMALRLMYRQHERYGSWNTVKWFWKADKVAFVEAILQQAIQESNSSLQGHKQLGSLSQVRTSFQTLCLSLAYFFYSVWQLERHCSSPRKTIRGKERAFI